MDVVMERWGYVTRSGAVVPVDLQRRAVQLGDPRWRLKPSAPWSAAEVCVHNAAFHRGDDVARVLAPAEVVALGRVTLELSRSNARDLLAYLDAWAKLAADGGLQSWTNNLRADLRRVLGEG